MLPFTPHDLIAQPLAPLQRPKFLAIIASATLALTLVKRASGRVDGFVIEGPTAGGHNAPPRGPLQCDDNGEPVYGPKDIVDLAKISELGLPFWLASSYGSPERLREALDRGAAGIQVGTAFAFCRESGITDAIKHTVIMRAREDDVAVRTDPLASPTGFPFKIVNVPGSVAEPGVYAERTRICDLGYLRQPYQQTNGTIGYRCPAEPVADYVRKGGKAEETVGRKCLCNGLLATISLPQLRKNGDEELPLITAGDDVRDLVRWLPPGESSYSATDVLNYLLTPVRTATENGAHTTPDA